MIAGASVEVKPIASGRLAVGSGHELAWTEWGNPAGLPVIYLHGGPGGGTNPSNVRTFDLTLVRLVLFDQRGCGRSTPWADLTDNDPEHLIGDIEALRQDRGIDRWLVAGGSWGSCLAMLYGQRFPERCLGFRLRGVFTGTRKEVTWWWHSIGRLFPDAYEQLLAPLDPSERDDPLTAYRARTADPDPAIHGPAALALQAFSRATAWFRPATTPRPGLAEALPLARFFTHYCAHDFFLTEGQVLRDLPRITHLPCEIVQGRYDVVTAPAAAWAVHRAWPGSGIEFVIEGNHTEQEAPIADALARATDRLLRRLSAVF